MWLDLAVPELESMTRDELVVLARGQAVRLDELGVVIARQDAQIAAMATQLADLMDKFERQAQELAKLQRKHSARVRWVIVLGVR